MLLVKEPLKELGKIKFGQTVNFTYCLENTGFNIISIDKLVVGCNSCTKAYTSKRLLKPGEKTLIEVAFTPGSIGQQKKWITVKYNGDYEIKLSFTADSYEH